MITIIQTCDGCKATRNILGTDQTTYSGWVTVTSLKHLCPACINKALEDD